MSLKTVPQSASGAAGYAVFYAYDLRGLETEARFGSANGLGIANAWDGYSRRSPAVTENDESGLTVLLWQSAGAGADPARPLRRRLWHWNGLSGAWIR
jgi:hypothetical protein